MNDTSTETTTVDLATSIKGILNTIERDREREIIARRFGLFDRKETLEQVGELLGITRERVRQLEKAIMIRLKMAAENNMPQIPELEKQFIRHLHDLGRVAKVNDLSAIVTNSDTELDRAHIAFIAALSP